MEGVVGLLASLASLKPGTSDGNWELLPHVGTLLASSHSRFYIFPTSGLCPRLPSGRRHQVWTKCGVMLMRAEAREGTAAASLVSKSISSPIRPSFGAGLRPIEALQVAITNQSGDSA